TRPVATDFSLTASHPKRRAARSAVVVFGGVTAGPIRRMNRAMSSYDLTPLSQERIEALAADFTPEEKHVILHQGTERPFCGLFLDNKKPGVYTCRLCGLPLFESDAKFESGTGWPSFFQPYDREHVKEISDTSHGMRRVEIRCQRCDAHL